MPLTERYIDPFSDFGFKKLFASEPNKELLIDFLNELLRGTKHIKDLSYSKNEQLGKTSNYRKAVFDLYCENEKGEKFIIEMQSVNQQYFRDRSLYYATFPIQEQAPEGEHWNYQLKEVYTIGIMDFALDDSHPDHFLHEGKIMETKTMRVLNNKLTFIYLEMPKFNKKETELITHFDKWLYLLKNLNKFEEIPLILQEHIFRRVFQIAAVSNLSEEEMKAYDASLKQKRDWNNILDTAKMESREGGRLEGRLEGKMEEKISIAKQLKKENMPLENIARITGLSIKEINNL